MTICRRIEGLGPRPRLLGSIKGPKCIRMSYHHWWRRGGFARGHRRRRNLKQLSIAIVSKVYPMRSHTVSAEGGTAAVLREFDNLDLHAKDTIFGADFLADQDAVEAFVKEAPRRTDPTGALGLSVEPRP